MDKLTQKLTASRFSFFEVACYCATVLLIDSVFYAALTIFTVSMINKLVKGMSNDK